MSYSPLSQIGHADYRANGPADIWTHRHTAACWNRDGDCICGLQDADEQARETLDARTDLLALYREAEGQ